MKIKLKKKDNGEYQATFTVDFDLGEIDAKLPEAKREDGKIIIQTGANVKQMKKLFRENLEQNIDMYDKRQEKGLKICYQNMYDTTFLKNCS